MSDLGPQVVGSTIYFTGTTAINGVPTDMAGSPAISVYKNSITQSTSGVTFTVPFDTTTGLFQVIVDTSSSSSFYATDNIFSIVVTTGTLGGISMVGYTLGTFQLTTSQTTVNATLNAVARGTVTTGASTTSIPTSAFAIAGAAASGVVVSQFVGRVVSFDGNTTTAGLRGAASTISASTASNTPTLTVAALPATAVSGDTFSVI